MAYATEAEIESEFKNLTIDTGTAITTATVATYLAQADAEINSRLGVKYETPITGTESLVLIKMIEIWLVKDRVQKAMKVKTGIEKSSQDLGDADYRKQALDLLADLASGKVALSDATLKDSSGGVKSYASSNSVENIFKVGVTQW
jgi:phage gp36-like protein